MKRTLSFLFLLLWSITSFGQELSGTVLSAEDSTAIAGAIVKVLNEGNAMLNSTTTGQDGRFKIEAKKGSAAKLTVQFTGCKTEQIALQGAKKDADLGRIYLSPDAQLLGEVVVKGNQRIAKAGRTIVFPTALEVKTSFSLLDLLQKLNLQGMDVDPTEQKVAINGSAPQYKINGVEKTKHDILTINPKNIARIEYESAPSIENIDKGVGGAINIILKEKDDGGNAWISLTASPLTGFINTDVYAAYNKKKSEFSVNYFNNWRDYTKRWTDKQEQYISADKETSRDFKGRHSPFGYLSQGVYLNYTWQRSANTMLSATFRNDFGKQRTTVNGMMDETDMGSPYFRHDKFWFSSYLPALDIYFRHSFKGQQSIEANVVGTYVTTDYDRNVIDGEDGSLGLTKNSVDNEKLSLIYEIVYRKTIKKYYLSLGYQGRTGKSQSWYPIEAGLKDRQYENNNYLYGSIAGSIGKVYYNLGTGLKIFTVRNDNEHRTFTDNRSVLNASYAPTNNLSLQLMAYYMPQQPMLSQLSDVTQTFDNMLKMRGNPDLKSSQSLGTRLTVNYSKKSFTSNLSLSFSRQLKTIYMDVQPTADGFLSQPLNATGDSHFNAEWKGTMQGILNHLLVQVKLGYNYYESSGKDFRHHLRDFYWGIGGQAYWGRWTLGAYYYKPKRTLMAQTLNLGENNSAITLIYKHKALQLYAQLKYPFCRNGWEWKEENLSKVNPHKTQVYIKDNSNMLLFGLVYSLNFGKSLRKLSKNLSNSDGADFMKVEQ